MNAVMVSGGIDSCVAAYLAPDDALIFVDYGQPYIKQERVAVERLYPDVNVVKMEGLPPLPTDKVHIPARNMMLAIVGLRFSNDVILAGVKDELCSDKSPAAFKAMSVMLSRHSMRKINVTSSLWNYTKDQAVELYLSLGGDPQRLLSTVSCYGDGSDSCKNCEACFRRAVALRLNGLEAPIHDDIIRHMLGKLHRMEQRRRWCVIKALGNDVLIHYLDRDGPPPETEKFLVVVSNRPSSERVRIHCRFPKIDALILESI